MANSGYNSEITKIYSVQMQSRISGCNCKEMQRCTRRGSCQLACANRGSTCCETDELTAAIGIQDAMEAAPGARRLPECPQTLVTPSYAIKRMFSFKDRKPYNLNVAQWLTHSLQGFLSSHSCHPCTILWPKLDPLPFTLFPKALPKPGSGYLNIGFLKVWQLQEENKHEESPTQ